MFPDSVVTRTGQFWKLALAFILLLVGSFVPLFESAGMSWTVGTILAVVGYAFGCLYIRCPHCGNRWFWSAARDGALYKPLMTAPACTGCHGDHLIRKNDDPAAKTYVSNIPALCAECHGEGGKAEEEFRFWFMMEFGLVGG